MPEEQSTELAKQSQSRSIPASPEAQRKTAISICLFMTVFVLSCHFFIPYGREILYPFNYIYTYAHEFGHGLSAMFSGGEFVKFVMEADGSGCASYRMPVDASAFTRAFVPFGGLIAPPILSAILLAFGKRGKSARISMFCFSVLGVINLVFLVRSFFGFLAVGILTALGFLLSILPKHDIVPQSATLLVAMTLLLETFTEAGYLFVQKATGDGISGTALSDVGAIQEYLFLPYWFWGGLIFAISVIILIAGVYYFMRSPKAHASNKG